MYFFVLWLVLQWSLLLRLEVGDVLVLPCIVLRLVGFVGDIRLYLQDSVQASYVQLRQLVCGCNLH